MNLVEEIKQEVLKINEQYVLEAEDGYDFWNNHIKFVVAESLLLAENYGADKEIVQIGAMLHDIALMKKVGTKKQHNLNGAKIAEELLTRLQVAKDKIQKILGCILHHSTSKHAKNLEELCVADADILAHFDNIPMCFYSAFKLKDLSLNDIDKIKSWFESDFNDLSDQTKKAFQEKYQQIMQILFK